MNPLTAGCLGLLASGLAVLVGALYVGAFLLGDAEHDHEIVLLAPLLGMTIGAAVAGGLLVWDALEREELSKRARTSVVVFVLGAIAFFVFTFWAVGLFIPGRVFAASAIVLAAIVARRDFSR